MRAAVGVDNQGALGQWVPTSQDQGSLQMQLQEISECLRFVDGRLVHATAD